MALRGRERLVALRVRGDVFMEGEVVFLHRSWTGYGVFAATFAPVNGGGWRIASAVVERDADRYGGTDDAYDCVMPELVITASVLGEPATDLRSKLVELTRRQPRSTDAPAGLIHVQSEVPRSTWKSPTRPRHRQLRHWSRP